MKKSTSRQFTLIELLFVITILVILISISWVAARKIFQTQLKRETQAEIKMLVAAVENYKIRYGSYPANDTSETPHPLSFGEKLSDTPPTLGYSGFRPMYIDFKKHGFKVSNPNYDIGNATKTKVFDPKENVYLYYLDSANDRFYIWSVGHDGVDSSSDDFKNIGADGDFGDDITSENLFR